MAFSTIAGAPAAYGIGASGSDDRALFLKQFGGEVLTAYTAATLTAGKTREKTIGAGKSWQYPRTGLSKAEYITRGQELLGNSFATDEVTVTVDAPLVASHALWDLDELMTHFDIRGPMTQEMGASLARTYDQNVFRSVMLAARLAAVTSVNSGGLVITNAALTANAGTNGVAWMEQIRAAKLALFAKNIPAGSQIYMAVNATVFDAIKYAQINGTFINLNSMVTMASAGTGAAPTDAMYFEGVMIFKSNLLPNTNETADASVYAKYRANYSTTTAIMWSPEAVASLSLLGVTVEQGRDFRRQEDVLIAKRVNGHGALRSELAVEFRTAAPV